MLQQRFFATTSEGLTLPIVDVTHPDFAIDVNESALEAMNRQFVTESASRRHLAPSIREALQHSMLGRSLLAASGTFLGGLPTYLLKLGPQNAGEWATPLDKTIVGSFPAFAARLRLQDMARLLADSAANVLEADD